MNATFTMRLIPLVVALAGCAATQGPRVQGAKPKARSVSPPLTRGQWLALAETISARPGDQLPRRSSAEFERLLPAKSWRGIEPAEVLSDKAVLRYHSVMKALLSRYIRARLWEEALEIGLLHRSLERVLLIAAGKAIERLPQPEEAKRVRRDGHRKMALSAAMGDVGLLGLSSHAPPSYQRRVYEALTKEGTYAAYPREVLQLLLVTYGVESKAPAAVGKRLPALRAVVAAQLATRAANARGPTRTYEPMVGPWATSGRPIQVRSERGRFSVEIFPGALVMTEEMKRQRGKPFVRHSIVRRVAGATFEAICSSQFSQMAEKLVAAGAQRRGRHPAGGTLFYLSKRNAHFRVVESKTRGCVVSVEDPRGQLRKGIAEAFLSAFEMDS